MKNYIAALIAVLTIGGLWAQDPHFSNPNNNLLYYNPSQAGLTNDLTIQAAYRNQWNAFTTPYSTTRASVDFKATKDDTKTYSIGVGFQFLDDNAGDANMGITQGNINVSGIMKLDNQSKLALGIMTGFGQRSIQNRLAWESQYINGYYNPLSANYENYDNQGYSYMDAGVGLSWSYDASASSIKANDGIKANIGISAFHFGLPQSSFYEAGDDRLNTKFVAHGRLEIGKKNTNVSFAPGFNWTRQGTLNELIVGSDINFLLKEASQITGFIQSYALNFGLHYRVKDAIIAACEFRYSQFSIRMSYDINLSKFIPATTGRGGFEIGLKFTTHNPYGPKGFRSKIN